MSTNDLNQILTERGERYGKFVNHARISQSLKRVIAYQPVSYTHLTLPTNREV